MQLIPSETLTVDRKARVNMPFYDLDLRLPNVRMCDFEDVIIPFSAERAMREAARCIHCPDPAPFLKFAAGFALMSPCVRVPVCSINFIHRFSPAS